MLRPELRRHITRCPDRGEVEPYSFKDNEQDSEGFYFKGDTSVPCYKKEPVSRTLDEDWDRDDEDTTSLQNLSEYYANSASLPGGSRQLVEDISSLNSREREQFKRNMRTQAVQSHHSAQQRFSDHANHREAAESIARRIGDIDIRREDENASNSYPRSQWFHPVNSNHQNDVTISKTTNFYLESMQDGDVPLHGQEKHWTSKKDDISASRNCNGFSKDEDKCLRSDYSTSGTIYSHQNNRHFDIATNTNNHSLGVARPEKIGDENSTGIPIFKGAGRAKLAEEARRMNFGLRRSGAPVGRGRGILKLFGSNYQG
ncbi:uncharacterized protein LOC116288255 isoform X2 [Actinia tenebrosa]|nr:uncharacterized protein LOC116288255 isoform X2 [Actinia tenebrosa]